MHYNFFETVSEDNFDELRYLEANIDLRSLKRKDPNFNAYEHFLQHGKQEGRRQLAIIPQNYLEKKFEKFRDILITDNYKFENKKNSFRLISKEGHLDLSDYNSESGNSIPGYWFTELNSNPSGMYLDLGCGVRDIIFDNCLYIEVYPSISADIIMTPNRPLPIKDGTLDGVACLAVLEHVENPFFVASEIKRVVKPGGKIFIDWPFLQPFHGYPSHYYNATEIGLKHMFEDAFEIELLKSYDEYQGANYTLSWILNWFIDGIENNEIKNKLMHMTVGELNSLKPQDEFYRACLNSMRDDTKRNLACGNTLIGRRR